MQVKAKSLYLILIASLVPTLAMTADPVLIDITVTGSMDAPTFTPESLELNNHNSYLFVITNDKPYSVTFNHSKLGQSVFTHALTGTHSVSAESFTLGPKSKVQWHFATAVPGENVFYASNTSLNVKGKAGKIVIVAKEEPSPLTRN